MSAENPRIERQPSVRLIGKPDTRLWGLDGAERLRRTLRRAGAEIEHGEATNGLLLLRADYLYEESLVRALLQRPGVALREERSDGAVDCIVAAHVPAPAASTISATAGPEAAARQAALEVLTPVALAGVYNSNLRKRARPYLLPLDSTPRSDLERASFAGAYKGATDFVTKFLWPGPARYVTRWCAVVGISPNAVTFASLLLVILTFWLFWTGQFALGLVAAWSMTFLDTVDGKLARVTLTSSRLGEFFDHGIDLIHPPFWYWAWYAGLATVPAAGGMAEWLPIAFWIIVAGYLLGRIEEGIFIARFGIEMHIWRRIDYAFRTITARRNSNLAILTLAVAVGMPAEGLVAVAIWTLVSLAFHLVRIAQAYALRAQGQPVRSWLTEQE